MVYKIVYLDNQNSLGAFFVCIYAIIICRLIDSVGRNLAGICKTGRGKIKEDGESVGPELNMIL